MILTDGHVALSSIRTNLTVGVLVLPISLKGSREVLLNRAHYVATATVGIRQGTGGDIDIFLLT